ncbi:MAG: hypothetical protein ACYCUI_15555, partial [Vulcanimicrobiaceae bacterium]
RQCGAAQRAVECANREVSPMASADHPAAPHTARNGRSADIARQFRSLYGMCDAAHAFMWWGVAQLLEKCKKR